MKPIVYLITSNNWCLLMFAEIESEASGGCAKLISLTPVMIQKGNSDTLLSAYPLLIHVPCHEASFPLFNIYSLNHKQETTQLQ